METPYILVTAAVKAETQSLCDCLDFLFAKPVGRRSLWCGRSGEIPVCVLTAGPGIVNTVQAMTACVEAEKPSLIIQVGCGGGFRQHGMQIGDVAVATSEVDVHLGIESETVSPALQELPFPVLTCNGMEFREQYPLDMNLATSVCSFLTSAWRSRGIQVFKGPFITGATVTATDARSAFLFRAFSPFMESMEGAAAAFLSLYYQIPLIEVRCVSNFVGKRNRTEWNLPLACTRSGEAAAAILPLISTDDFLQSRIDGRVKTMPLDKMDVNA